MIARDSAVSSREILKVHSSPLGVIIVLPWLFPSSFHSTSWASVPVTVAVKLWLSPTKAVAVSGLIVTLSITNLSNTFKVIVSYLAGSLSAVTLTVILLAVSSASTVSNPDSLIVVPAFSAPSTDHVTAS